MSRKPRRIVWRLGWSKDRVDVEFEEMGQEIQCVSFNARGAREFASSVLRASLESEDALPEADDRSAPGITSGKAVER